jgi:hypothetical protein
MVQIGKSAHCTLTRLSLTNPENAANFCIARDMGGIFQTVSLNFPEAEH